MKKIFYIISVLFVVISLNSCQKKITTANLTSKTIYFPVITLNGDSYVEVQQGNAYTDPGCTATLNGATVDVTTQVVGVYSGYTGATVNFNMPDIYQIVYTATSPEGYSISANRTIFVIPTNEDLTTGIQGLYTSTVERNGSPSAQYTDMAYIFIGKLSSTTYYLSDAIGGYYDLGRGYGPDYAAKGLIITVNNYATQDFSFNNPIKVGPWSEALNISSMVVNAVSGTVYWEADWDAGYLFKVTLTQQ